MSKSDLKKARADTEFTYYESIAKLIVDAPTVSLAELRKAHGITHHEMWRAQTMFHVHRKGQLSVQTGLVTKSQRRKPGTRTRGAQ